MKTLCTSTLLLLFLAAQAFGQPVRSGRVELSLSGMFQSYASSGSSSSTGVVFLSPRVGVFVHEGLEIEGEGMVLLPSSSDPVYALSGLFSYNFHAPGPGVPFVLIGFGFANTVPMLNVPTYRFNFAVGVVNLGAGVKIFVKEDVAIRLEYRFQKFSGSGTQTPFAGYTYSEELDSRIHSVQFGFSILF